MMVVFDSDSHSSLVKSSAASHCADCTDSTDCTDRESSFIQETFEHSLPFVIFQTTPQSPKKEFTGQPPYFSRCDSAQFKQSIDETSMVTDTPQTVISLDDTIEQEVAKNIAIKHLEKRIISNLFPLLDLSDIYLTTYTQRRRKLSTNSLHYASSSETPETSYP